MVFYANLIAVIEDIFAALLVVAKSAEKEFGHVDKLAITNITGKILKDIVIT